MDEDLVCVCHYGGERVPEEGEFLYEGGVTACAIARKDITYDEFLLLLSETLSTDVHGKKVYYTNNNRKKELVHLNGIGGLIIMFRLNKNCVDVYVDDESPKPPFLNNPSPQISSG